MSEEILKALTQLFAIITKQDEGVTQVERDFVERFFKQRLTKEGVTEYLALYEEFLQDKKKRSSKGGDEEKKSRKKLTSVTDSVRTLAICKKINKTLTQKQKVIVLIEILELVNSDKNFTPQRREIINTVSEVFNIPEDEHENIEKFVLANKIEELDKENILLVSNNEEHFNNARHVKLDYLDGYIVFLKVNSVELAFVKYIGADEISLNSQLMYGSQAYLYSPGSTIKPSKSAPLYYSDIIAQFSHDGEITPLTFNCKDVGFVFPNGAVGLHNINISETHGKLIGIMGASGAGKTTLLNVLAGLEKPTSGNVLINGIDIHEDKENIHGVIGYIAQDDILIEDLTVFENLYYNAKLCFKNKSEEEIQEKVTETLESLGLNHIRELKVGSVLNKKISGGQRKRLNIALELIREPAVMFVDEPTSGLSSRDSENVIDLLKELSLKGKLIFVVIHQPSSEIYKMFDKMFIMDTGGYPIYYGNPIEAIVHFKNATNQINADRGQCPECGNANPEQLFDMVEARVVNEYGTLTNKRKIKPDEWWEVFKQKFTIRFNRDEEVAPPKELSIPGKLKQWLIFTIRDVKSKVSNKQYMLINLLEAPILAGVLAFIIRYKNAPGSDEYVYRYNENIPAYILMSIIVALFMGLTVSAEEIIRDRKILKRERFLNLSKGSYLYSKIGILFTLSGVQTLMFVLVGNAILGIDGMYFPYWFMLFSVSCFANVLGLNISASFNSAVTVYIVIPLLLIPQMVLSGALFSFDKLNSTIAAKDKVPVIADLMASRWAYEGLAVNQYKHNDYFTYFYELEKEKSQANYLQAYLLPELNDRINFIQSNYKEQSDSMRKVVMTEAMVVKNTLKEIKKHYPELNLDLENWSATEESIKKLESEVKTFLEQVAKENNQKFSEILNTIDLTTQLLIDDPTIDVNKLKDEYFNESLDELVRNIRVTDRVVAYNGILIQQIDPVYMDPVADNVLDYRAHFFAPTKNIFNKNLDTFWFNVGVIWLMSILLFVTLYFEAFRAAFEKLSRISLKKEKF